MGKDFSKIGCVIILILGFAKLSFAGVHFLPDYLEAYKGYRNPQGTHNPPPTPKCSDYSGYVDSCPSPQIGRSVRLGLTVNCYTECQCPARFQYTAQNCNNGSVLDGEVCDSKYENCRAPECSKLCDGFEEGKICAVGQTSQLCGSGCGDWVKCNGEPCEQGFSCEVGCAKYSENPNCVDVCIECKNVIKECPMGSWNIESYWCDAALKCFFN